MRKALAGLFGAMLLTVTMAGGAVAADPFQNGSFEDIDDTYDEGPSGFMALDLPSEFGLIPGWVVGGAGIDWKGPTYWQHADGFYGIDLNHKAAGTISQEFRTKTHTKYMVGFEFAGNPVDSGACPDGASKVKTMDVRATGGHRQSYAFDVSDRTLADMGWRYEAYLFEASGKTTVLTFTSTSTTYCGPAIDEVVVTTGADCQKGGWKSMLDDDGASFASKRACLKFYK